MELKKLLAPLRQWWWLLVATTLVAALSSYLALSSQPALYQSRTTLMIGRAIEDPNPSGTELALTLQLTEIYADIGNRDPMRNSTMEALGLNALPEYEVRALQDTQLIEITVVDTNPERAQIVANELANQLSKRSPTGQAGDQDRKDFINQQLDALEVQIQEARDQVTELQDELGRMISAQQISDTQNQIAALQTKINTLNDTYASLLSNTEQGAINTISVIEPAELPRRPLNTHKELMVLLAAGIGLVLAVGVVYTVEYLDDTLKTEEDVRSVLKSPILGFVAQLPDRDNSHQYIAEQPRSPVADAFRSLRTNLEFVSVGKPIQTILISSPEASDGKSTVATNLAISIAQTDKKVILLDADLRRPYLHKALNLDNYQGLSDLFRKRLSLQEAMAPLEKENRVMVITSGPLAPNPTELLASSRMDEILAELKQYADIIIVDAAPFFVADASVLASKVDGLLLVVRPGRTHKGATASMRDQVQRVGANVLGVVLNSVSGRFGSYQGYSYHYGYGVENEEETAAKQGLLDRLGSIFRSSDRKGAGNHRLANLGQTMFERLRPVLRNDTGKEPDEEEEQSARP